MNEKLRRKLIWKYFWKRKREEICGFIKENYIYFLFTPLLLSLPGIMMCSILDPTMDLLISKILYWVVISYFLLLTLILLVYIIITCIKTLIQFIKTLMQWLKQNWEWATEDAERELNRRSRISKTYRSPSASLSASPSKLLKGGNK